MELPLQYVQLSGKVARPKLEMGRPAFLRLERSTEVVVFGY